MDLKYSIFYGNYSPRRQEQEGCDPEPAQLHNRGAGTLLQSLSEYGARHANRALCRSTIFCYDGMVVWYGMVPWYGMVYGTIPPYQYHQEYCTARTVVVALVPPYHTEW